MSKIFKLESVSARILRSLDHDKGKSFSRKLIVSYHFQWRIFKWFQVIKSAFENGVQSVKMVCEAVDPRD